VSAIDFLKEQHDEVDGLFERLAQAREDQRISLLAKIAEKLTLHGALEEGHLYPLAREAGFEELTDHSLEEHAEVKRLTSEILGSKRHDPKLKGLWEKLKERVEHHVAEEEQKLFPQLLERVGEARLQELESRLREAMSRLENEELLEAAEAQHTPQP
jgi:hemerythrin superfamily protein